MKQLKGHLPLHRGKSECSEFSLLAWLQPEGPEQGDRPQRHQAGQEPGVADTTSWQGRWKEGHWALELQALLARTSLAPVTPPRQGSGGLL